MNYYQIKEDFDKKSFKSSIYNYNFDKTNGFFMRWGENKNDDPLFSPFGPEILDLEISSGGDCLGNCRFCYKGNGGSQKTHNMTLDEFKVIFHKMPKTLTQIAFGIMNISTNPDFFSMMEYSNNHGIIPNYTCHGLDVNKEIADKTAKTCGAVAVSIVNKESSYNAVELFMNSGMNQVNIHRVLCEENYDETFSIIDDITKDSRLKNLNAIVFLQYKSKGKNTDDFHSIQSIEKYKRLIKYCEDNNVNYGLDSCSAPVFFSSVKNHKNKDVFKLIVEPCESGLFSSYINCHGDFFPCSFAEGENNWENGISVLDCDDFLKDVWYNSRISEWRNKLLKSSQGCDCEFSSLCRSCFLYNVNHCKQEVK